MSRPVSCVSAYLLARDVELAHRKRKHARGSALLAELVPVLEELARRELDGAQATIARVLAEARASEAASSAGEALPSVGGSMLGGPAANGGAS